MKRLLLLLAALLLQTTTAIAQSAPDFAFRIRTNDGDGGPFQQWTTVTSGWNQFYSKSGCLSTETLFTGSVSDDSITLGGISESQGDGTCGPYGVAPSNEAGYSVRVYVKGTTDYAATVELTAGYNASVSNETTTSGPSPRSAYYGPIPYGSSDLKASLNVAGYGSIQD